MLKVGFVGTFPAGLEQPVRRYLAAPCDIIVIIVADEAGILPRLEEIDVLVTMTFSLEMGRFANR